MIILGIKLNIVVNSALIICVAILLTKIVYEISGTFMSYFSATIGSGALKGAINRTFYSLLGMIMTQLQIKGQDNPTMVIISAMIGCFIGTFAGQYIRDRLFTTVKPYQFFITCKNKESLLKVIAEIDKRNFILKEKGIKTIGYDTSEGTRPDKDYFHITATCYEKEHTRQIKEIKEMFTRNEAIFMYNEVKCL